MRVVEIVDRRTLAKILACSILVAGLLAGVAGTAQARGLDDMAGEAPEVEHGIEIEVENELENEIEHAVEIENEIENELENLENELEAEHGIEVEIENELLG